MSARTTLNRLRAFDAAWNARDWDACAVFLDEEFVAFGARGRGHGKAAFLRLARRCAARWPAARLAPEAYAELFANPDGTRSCSVLRIDGAGPCALVAIQRWRGTRIVQCRFHFYRMNHATQGDG